MLRVRFDRKLFDRLFFGSLVLITIFLTVDTVREVLRERRWIGVDVSGVVLDQPLQADAPIVGRISFLNLHQTPVRVVRKGETYAWLDWSQKFPEQARPDISGSFGPCENPGDASEPELPPGETWWCFRQVRPTLGDADLQRLRGRPPDWGLWLGVLITYQNSRGLVRHSRLCRRYDPVAGFDPRPHQPCDWFD